MEGGEVLAHSCMLRFNTSAQMYMKQTSEAHLCAAHFHTYTTQRQLGAAASCSSTSTVTKHAAACVQYLHTVKVRLALTQQGHEIFHPCGDVQVELLPHASQRHPLVNILQEALRSWHGQVPILPAPHLQSQQLQPISIACIASIGSVA